MNSIEVRPFPDHPQHVDEILACNAQVTVSRLSQSSLSLTVRTSDDLRVFTMFTEPPTTPLDAWGVEPPDDVIFTSDPLIQHENASIHLENLAPYCYWIAIRLPHHTGEDEIHIDFLADEPSVIRLTADP